MTIEPDAELARRIESLTTAADRLDELADTASLMDDETNAERWRVHAAAAREAAMQLIDARQNR